jgi:hypothetical protein
MTLLLIYLGSIFCTLVLAQEPQKVPTIQDEIFSYTQSGRIPLEFVKGVVSIKHIKRVYQSILTICHLANSKVLHRYNLSMSFRIPQI